MQHLLTRFAIVSGVATALAGFAAPTSAVAATAAPAAASPILLYAQDWNGYSSSRSTAAWQEAAVTHQILVGSPGPVYGDMIGQLHAWNPELKVLAYDLGPYTIAGTSDYTTLMSEHPDYFARDAHGNLITMVAANGSPAFPNNTLMDEGNPGWQAFEAQRVASEISAWGFDGAYIDSMGPGVVTGSTTGVPIDPSTGQAYTQAQWMEAGGAALDAIKAAIGSKFLFSTGLVNGPDYQSFTDSLADSTADGFQTNSWMRLADASLTAWPSPSLLASDLAMVQSLQARGKAFFAWTSVWTSATPAQVSAWNTYALAAYLLVDNGVNDYYTFDTPFASDRTTIFDPNELAALGAPDGPFTLSNGVYSRSFQFGSVTLNTTTNAATITTSTSYGVGGGYTLDAFGGVHPFGDAPPVTTTGYWPGWTIAVSIQMNACDTAGQYSGWVMDGFGGLHPFAAAGTPMPAAPYTTGYWPGWTIANDFTAFCITVNNVRHAAGCVLDGFGGLHPWADSESVIGDVSCNGTGYWPGWDIATKIAVIPGTDQGYVMDDFGGLHPFNGAPTANPSGYWPGWTIARGIVATANGGYTVDAFGGIHPFGNAPVITPTGYWPDQDVVRGIAMAAGGTSVGAYTLDGFGAVYPAGGALPLPVSGYWPDWDVVVGFVTTP